METKLISHLAWKYAKSTGIAFEELQSEATVAYLEAAASFTPGKGASESTYAYFCIKNRLINFVKKEMKFKESLVEFLPEKPTMQVPFFEMFELLSDKGKDVASMVLKDFNKYAGQTAWQARGDIGRDLLSLGWRPYHVAKVMQELKLVFN